MRHYLYIFKYVLNDHESKAAQEFKFCTHANPLINPEMRLEGGSERLKTNQPAEK